MANIFQEQITAQKPKALSEERIYVYVPRVTETTPGIATYDGTHFGIDNGQVYLKLTDPRDVPSLIKIRDGTDGLKYEDGYLKTNLKTINGESLNGEGNISLPTAGDVNSAINLALANSKFISKGILPYDTSFTYKKDAITYEDATRSFYLSKVDNNLNNSLSNTTYWKKIEIAGISEAEVNTIVNSAINTHNISNTAHNDIRTLISNIQLLIPAQASAENQLADKNFVNSSIATNTANFIGTFANVTALENYSGTVTNNDYANVINQELDFVDTTEMNAYDKDLLTNYDYAWIPNNTKYDLYRFDIETQTWENRATHINKDAVSLITAYNRYKYNAITQEWLWDYTINTSGFTAAQWAAINSGATVEQIAKIGTAALTTTAQDLSAAINELVLAKQNALTAGSNIQINDNVISATDTTYTAGNGVSINSSNVITTCLSGAGAPTTGTVGSLYQFYYDTTNNKLYQCSNITSTGDPVVYTYTWSTVGGADNAVTLGTETQTFEGSKQFNMASQKVITFIRSDDGSKFIKIEPTFGRIEMSAGTMARQKTIYKGGAISYNSNDITFQNKPGVFALTNDIFPDFSTSSTYAVGDLVTYNNTFYRCTTAVTIAGAWDANNWTATTLEAEVKAKASKTNVVTLDTTTQSFEGSKTLNIPSGGAIKFIYNNNDNKFVRIDSGNAKITVWNASGASNTAEYRYDSIYHGSKMNLPYNKAGTFALTNDIFPDFSTSLTYAVGDLVTYNNAFYRCITAVTTAGAWDANNWTATTLEAELKSKLSTIAIDNSSITENSSNQLQTVGVIDQKTGNANKQWTGTLAEYNLILTKDPDTLYIITDAAPTFTASDMNSETATSGQVLTADGSGGASWATPSGGKVYRHNIYLSGGNSGVLNQARFSVTNTRAEVYSSLADFAANIGNDCKYGFGEYGGNKLFYFFEVTSTSIRIRTYTITASTDGTNITVSTSWTSESLSSFLNRTLNDSVEEL